MHCTKISAEFKFGVIAHRGCAPPKMRRWAMTLAKSAQAVQFITFLMQVFTHRLAAGCLTDQQVWFPGDMFTKIRHNLQFYWLLPGRVTNPWDDTQPVYPSNSSVKGHLPGTDSPNINYCKTRFFACPLFREFREPDKFAKITGTRKFGNDYRTHHYTSVIGNTDRKYCSHNQ